MKGKISERLESILKDPSAHAELRTSLLKGRKGIVHTGGKTYIVSRATISPQKSQIERQVPNNAE